MQKWTLAHDGGHRYGAMTTNLSENFNSILKSAKNLPIIALVELTYYHCVAYFANRYTKARVEVTAGELITAYAKNKFNKWEKMHQNIQLLCLVIKMVSEMYGFQIATAPPKK